MEAQVTGFAGPAALTVGLDPGLPPVRLPRRVSSEDVRAPDDAARCA